MNIALFGATGTIGQRILAEALNRGHRVTAYVRDPSKLTTKHANLTVKTASGIDAATVAAAAAGQDVVVSAYGPRPGDDPAQLSAVARALLEGIARHPTVRLIHVGGAGSLEVAPGVQLVDTPGFPDAIKPIVYAHRDALDIYRKSTGNWTYFSPAGLIQPGERTGKFRLGGDQLVATPDGQSRISAEDYAVALVDEAEKPQFTRKRFTIGY
jgi:putative NADH-flavin reductase